MKLSLKTGALCFLLMVVSNATAAVHFLNGERLYQFGIYRMEQGQPQFIGINGAVGDFFSVTRSNEIDPLIGFGYMLPGPDTHPVRWSYGLNLFYFTQTKVEGVITQEGLFHNLAYSYKVQQLPIFLMGRASVDSAEKHYSIFLDGGVGYGFIRTSDYRDVSLDGGITIPDNAFYGQTESNITGTIGIGLRVNNILYNDPIECGYRFFHFARASLIPRTNQILNQLTTGVGTAHAFICAVSF